jgi:hypothetical protein
MFQSTRVGLSPSATVIGHGRGHRNSIVLLDAIAKTHGTDKQARRRERVWTFHTFQQASDQPRCGVERRVKTHDVQTHGLCVG